MQLFSLTDLDKTLFRVLGSKLENMTESFMLITAKEAREITLLYFLVRQDYHLFCRLVEVNTADTQRNVAVTKEDMMHFIDKIKASCYKF